MHKSYSYLIYNTKSELITKCYNEHAVNAFTHISKSPCIYVHTRNAIPMSVRKRHVLDNLKFLSTPKYEICFMYTEQGEIHIFACTGAIFSFLLFLLLLFQLLHWSWCVFLFVVCCVAAVCVFREFWMFDKRIQQRLLHRKEHLIFIKLRTTNIYVKFHTWVEMHVMLLCCCCCCCYYSYSFSFHNFRCS